MNNFSSWLAKLMMLVETYSSARAAPGGTVAGANVATAVALADIVQHASDHPEVTGTDTKLPGPTPNRAGGTGEE